RRSRSPNRPSPHQPRGARRRPRKARGRVRASSASIWSGGGRPPLLPQTPPTGSREPSVQPLHELFEDVAPMLEILEHVERGARRREQYHVAGHGQAAPPIHSTQAVAASTFSTLCAPRRKISATGQISSTSPLSCAAIRPSRTNTPCDSGRRRLNHTTWARVRRASAAVASSSALRTAQSADVWLAKIRAFAST